MEIEAGAISPQRREQIIITLINWFRDADVAARVADMTPLQVRDELVRLCDIRSEAGVRLANVLTRWMFGTGDHRKFAWQPVAAVQGTLSKLISEGLADRGSIEPTDIPADLEAMTYARADAVILQAAVEARRLLKDHERRRVPAAEALRVVREKIMDAMRDHD